jgi:hypothetical protein
MTAGRTLAAELETLDALSVAVLTDDVSDNYVSKTRFAESEFNNVVRRGAGVWSRCVLLRLSPSVATITAALARTAGTPHSAAVKTRISERCAYGCNPDGTRTREVELRAPPALTFVSRKTVTT